MKRLSFIFAVIGMMYVYNVFADKTPISVGCEEADCYECKSWVVTPDGVGMILGRGYNSYYVVN